MLSGVLEVIESVSSANMSIQFQLSPYSEQEAKNYPPPPHPVFNRTKWLWDITEIVNNFPAFKVIVMQFLATQYEKKSYERPKCA